MKYNEDLRNRIVKDGVQIGLVELDGFQVEIMDFARDIEEQYNVSAKSVYSKLIEVTKIMRGLETKTKWLQEKTKQHLKNIGLSR